jgi:predicted phosphodiesterase
MRVAVISDVHGALRPLQAVLADVEGQCPDELWFLGDLVGGPDTIACCELIHERATLALAGNHDFWVLGSCGRYQQATSSLGRALGQAEEQLNCEPELRRWLAGLRPLARRHQIMAVHASPRDPYMEFVTSRLSAAQSLLSFPEDVGLLGHTHRPAAFRQFERSGKNVLKQVQIQPGQTVRIDGCRSLLNPGAVLPEAGQSWWMMLDLKAQNACWHWVFPDNLTA